MFFGNANHRGSKPKRDRTREGIGKSERSHIKHNLIKRVVGGQIGAYRLKNKGRIVIIDGNAGDGQGVDLPQIDLFDSNRSITTAELAVRIAEDVGNAEVILCDRNKERRTSLSGRFADVTILKDNALASDAIPPDCHYAIWISDPCGPAGHGVEAMRAVADRLRSDFVIAVNEGSIRRIAGTDSELWSTSRERYAQMIESPRWWADRLGRERLTRTPIINGASNFKYRIIVAANVLSDAARRKPFEEVL